MKKLFIVESPGKLKTISGYLGAGYEVVASVGHIRDLPKKAIGVEPPNFKPDYVVTESGKKAIGKIKAKMKLCDDVYLATDLDREGEAIAWHLKEVLGLQNPKRVVFSEITKDALEKAIENPRKIDNRMVAAQEARRSIDRVIGYTVSPAISKKLGGKGLSGGRVQSPALLILDNREREIANFKPKTHYSVTVDLGGWKAFLDIKSIMGKDSEYLFSKEIAQKIAQCEKFKVEIAKKGTRKKAPPAPFRTVTLQKAASAQFGFSPSETMEVAQKLYENGLITYMRTDSTLISDTAFSQIYSFSKKENYPVIEKKRVWKNDENSQEAHECIRPSKFELVSPSGLKGNEEKLYDLIRRRALASQMDVAEYDTYKLALSGSAINSKVSIFTASTECVKSQGWLVFGNVDKDDFDGESEAISSLPDLQIGSMLEGKGEVVQKSTRSPSRYSESSLISELEKLGIGRPATYAAIIENLLDKKYVQLSKAKHAFFSVTKLGAAVAHTLRSNFSFCEFDFTKVVESSLDEISKGNMTYLSVVSPVHEKITNEIIKMGV